MGFSMRFWVVLALMALPAQAEECFSGSPSHVSYDDGHEITIIQRHGDDVTYTQPYEGFQDSVHKTHLMLFSKQARHGARSSENRWTSRLPGLDDMVPGYHFDIEGTMKSGDAEAIPYRNEGEVLGVEEVKLGACSYPALVIRVNTYLNDQLAITATEYLSAEMLVLLRSEHVVVISGKVARFQAVAIQ